MTQLLTSSSADILQSNALKPLDSVSQSFLDKIAVEDMQLKQKFETRINNSSDSFKHQFEISTDIVQKLPQDIALNQLKIVGHSPVVKDCAGHGHKPNESCVSGRQARPLDCKDEFLVHRLPVL